MPPRVRADLRNTIQIEPLQVKVAQSDDGPLYGTRLSTVILVRRDGKVLFVERDIWLLGEENKAFKAANTNDRVFTFHLEPYLSEDKAASAS